MNKRFCKCGCGVSINHKHINAKFLNQRHKDTYHNLNNPRGKFEHLKMTEDDKTYQFAKDQVESGWDGHK